MEKRAELEDLNMSGMFEATEIMTIEHSASTRACGWCLSSVGWSVRGIESVVGSSRPTSW